MLPGVIIYVYVVFAANLCSIVTTSRDFLATSRLSSAQLYGTVYQQQFVKLTACVRLSASSKHVCLFYVLMTDYSLFLQTFVMHSRSGAE